MSGVHYFAQTSLGGVYRVVGKSHHVRPIAIDSKMITLEILPKITYTYSNEICYEKIFKQSQNVKNYKVRKYMYEDGEFALISSNDQDSLVPRESNIICKYYNSKTKVYKKCIILWVEPKKMFIYDFIDKEIYALPLYNKLYPIHKSYCLPENKDEDKVTLIIPGLSIVENQHNKSSITERKNPHIKRLFHFKKYVSDKDININNSIYRNKDKFYINHKNVIYLSQILWIDCNKIFALTDSHSMIFILSINSKDIWPLTTFSLNSQLSIFPLYNQSEATPKLTIHY